MATLAPVISRTLANGLASMAHAAGAPANVLDPLEKSLALGGETVPAEGEWAFWEAAAKSARNLPTDGPAQMLEGTWSDLELGLHAAATVREALETLADASDVLHGVKVFFLVPRPDGAALVYESPHTRRRAPGALAAELALSTVVETIRRITGDRHVAPRRAFLVGEPVARTSALARTLGCPVEVGATIDRLELDRELLDMPLPGAEPRVHRLALRVIELERRELARNQPSFGVRRALDQAALSGEPAVETLAATLQLTPRALRERLAREELNVRELVDAARRRSAEHLLLSGCSPTEVQLKLNYSDLASFRRACRRWWGMGPRARRTLLLTAVNNPVSGLHDLSEDDDEVS